MKGKPRIIYIAGSGHSGSTLLNILLGTAKNTFAAGELKFTRQFIEEVQRPPKEALRCDCGSNAANCPFWSKALRGIRPRDLMALGLHKGEKLRLAMKILWNGARERVKSPGEERLFSQITKAATKMRGEPITCIIDSSKDLKRLVKLANMEGFDLAVIHLVRDGRAVAHSHRKRGMNWLSGYLSWVNANLMIALFLKQRVKQRMQVSYDQLASNPTGTLKEIKTRFGLELDEKRVLQKINRRVHHNFAGNVMRRSRFPGIRHDHSWRKKLPAPLRVILGILTWLPNRFWVY